MEALCERFLSHVERGVFPGGCFFASVAAELDTRPGPVRDRIVDFQSNWSELVASGLLAAQGRGELDPIAGIEQLTFEINAMLAHATTVFLLNGDHKLFDLARRAIRDRLERAALARAVGWQTGYSRSPAASRARWRSRKSSHLTSLPSR